MKSNTVFCLLVYLVLWRSPCVVAKLRVVEVGDLYFIKASSKPQPVRSVGFARDGQSIAFGSRSAFGNVNQRGPLQKTIVLKSEDEYKASRSGAVEDEIDYLRAQSTYGNYTLKTTKIQDPVLKITRDRRVYKTIRRDAASGYAHHCYTFTRDGRYLVSGGGNGFLTLYETETGRKVRDFVGHTGDVWAIAVAPDNQFLVSGKD